jgi:hypothetical protein
MSLTTSFGIGRLYGSDGPGAFQKEERTIMVYDGTNKSGLNAAL